MEQPVIRYVHEKVYKMSVILRTHFLIILIIKQYYYNSNNYLCALHLWPQIRDGLYENCYYYFIPVLLLLLFFKALMSFM